MVDGLDVEGISQKKKDEQGWMGSSPPRSTSKVTCPVHAKVPVSLEDMSKHFIDF